MRRTALLGLISVTSGCMPFVLPPGQASAGGATTGASPRASARSGSDETGSYTLRAGAHPLGFLEGQRDRTLDFGAGYQLERAARERGYTRTHGPYLELDLYPLRAHSGDWTARFGLRGMAELLVLDDPGHWGEIGGGGTLALGLELTSFADGPFVASSSDALVAGIAHGEAGVGAFAGVSHRRFADDQYWLATAGLSLRVPFVAGVVCCLRPN